MNVPPFNIFTSIEKTKPTSKRAEALKSLFDNKVLDQVPVTPEEKRLQFKQIMACALYIIESKNLSPFSDDKDQQKFAAFAIITQNSEQVKAARLRYANALAKGLSKSEAWGMETAGYLAIYKNHPQRKTISNLSEMMRKKHKQYGDDWIFAGRQEFLENEMFRPFLVQLGQFSSQNIQYFLQKKQEEYQAYVAKYATEDENQSRRFEMLQKLADYLANLKDHYFDAIRIVKKEKNGKGPVDQEEPLLPKVPKPIAIAVTADEISQGKEKSTRAIMEKITIPVKKFAEHQERWDRSGLADMMEILLSECKPSQHQPIIDVLNHPALWDMLLQSCAPEDVNSHALSVSSLNLSRTLFNDSKLATSPETEIAYQLAAKANKKNPPSQNRYEIIHRFEVATQQEKNTDLQAAFDIIREHIRGQDIPTPQRAI